MGPYGELKRTQYQFCASVTMQILRQINMYVHTTTTWSAAWYSTTASVTQCDMSGNQLPLRTVSV